MLGHLFPLLLSLSLKCALVLVCLLAHELGHYLVARHYGVSIRKIGLNWTGLYIRRARTTGWPEILVCMAGPAMNLALALAFWNISYWFALCNLVVGLVNLLPITHSDGSHALDALRAMRNAKTQRVPVVTSVVARSEKPAA